MKRIIVLSLSFVLLLYGTALAGEKKVFNPQGASSLPLSSAVEAAGLVFTSGQIPADAEGNVPENFKDQMHLAMKNLEKVLVLAGSSLDKVVKVTIFLEDFDDFPVMNEVYGSYFKKDYPVRSTVEVSKLALDVKVEIEAIAVK